MTESIIVAIITGGLTLLGTLVSNKKAQAVMEYKVEELTREVRAHNNFAQRIPVIETKVATLEKETETLKNAKTQH